MQGVLESVGPTAGDGPEWTDSEARSLIDVNALSPLFSLQASAEDVDVETALYAITSVEQTLNWL